MGEEATDSEGETRSLCSVTSVMALGELHPFLQNTGFLIFSFDT